MTTLPNWIRRTTGFTLIEIMITILIIGMLLAIAMPLWIGARERSHTRTCVAQLEKIRYAKESWGMDNRKESDDVAVWDDLYPTYLKSQPACPSGGTYTIGALNTPPTCSIGGTHVLE